MFAHLKQGRSLYLPYILARYQELTKPSVIVTQALVDATTKPLCTIHFCQTQGMAAKCSCHLGPGRLNSKAKHQDATCREH